MPYFVRTILVTGTEVPGAEIGVDADEVRQDVRHGPRRRGRDDEGEPLVVEGANELEQPAPSLLVELRRVDVAIDDHGPKCVTA